VTIVAKSYSGSGYILFQVPQPERQRGPNETGAAMTVPDHVQVTLSLHPLDYMEFRVAARAAGLDEQSFGVLAIHRAAQCALGTESAGQGAATKSFEVI